METSPRPTSTTADLPQVGPTPRHGRDDPRLRPTTATQMEPVERDDLRQVGETSGARRPGAVANTTTTTRWSPTTPRWRSSSATTCGWWRLSSGDRRPEALLVTTSGPPLDLLAKIFNLTNGDNLLETIDQAKDLVPVGRRIASRDSQSRRCVGTNR